VSIQSRKIVVIEVHVDGLKYKYFGIESKTGFRRKNSNFSRVFQMFNTVKVVICISFFCARTSGGWYVQYRRQ
jgi:hypothetical protein